MQISAIGSVTGALQSLPTQPAQAVPQNPTLGFGNVLQEMVGKVNELQTQADQSIQSLATGQGKGLHEVMLAVEKASVSFQMLTQVRNKAVEAYQEIMRMPV
jgi:flagellar hook-basal body complex protein FliE